MDSMKKRIGLGALIGAFVFVAACERTITRVEQTTTPQSCVACHSDVNTALVAAQGQWSNSRHASGENIDRNTATCSPCHTSEGFVRKVNGGTPATIVNPTVIHCFTCHAPHTTGDLSLRIEEPQRLKNGVSYDLHEANICIACHQSRNGVNTYVAEDTIQLSERWGPHHGVQGDMVLATNGYEYEGYEYERLTFHKEATEDGCLDCHFATTRNNVLGGHSFNMAYAAEGGEEEINTEGCNVEGCHSGELEDFNYDEVQEEVEGLIAQLETLLIDAKLLVYYADEDEWLPPEDEVLSRSQPGDSAGALWNYFMAWEDRSKGVHNSEYIKGLLESSIDFLEGDLNPPAPSVATGENGKTTR